LFRADRGQSYGKLQLPFRHLAFRNGRIGGFSVFNAVRSGRPTLGEQTTMQSCDQSSFLLGPGIILVKGSAPGEAGNPLATIREVATQFVVSPRTLRFYESKGLISPLREDGARLYRKKDRERLALILKAKKFGFTLAEIREMIRVQEGRAVGPALMLTRKKCGEQIDLLEQQLEEISQALAELRRLHTLLAGPAGDPQADRLG
jgi:DNA-binding transcriptional MerR regulator